MNNDFHLYKNGIESLFKHSLEYVSENCSDALSAKRTLNYLKNNVFNLIDDYYSLFCSEVNMFKETIKINIGNESIIAEANIKIMIALCIKQQASKRLKLFYLNNLIRLPMDEIEYLIIYDREACDDLEKMLGYQVNDEQVFIIDSDLKKAYSTVLKKIKILPMAIRKSTRDFKSYSDGLDYYYGKIMNCYTMTLFSVPQTKTAESSCWLIYRQMVELYQCLYDFTKFQEESKTIFLDGLDILKVFEDRLHKEFPMLRIGFKFTNDFDEDSQAQIIKCKDHFFSSSDTVTDNIFLKKLAKNKLIYLDEKNNSFYFQDHSYAYVISFIATFMYKLYINIWYKNVDEMKAAGIMNIIKSVNKIASDKDPMFYLKQINSEGWIFLFLFMDKRIEIYRGLINLNEKLTRKFNENR